MSKEDLKKDFKPVDRRIMRVIKKKAFQSSLFLLIPFLSILMLLMGDICVALVWAVPFSIFWYSGYRHAQYFLLSERYPDRFPPIIHNDDSESFKTSDDIFNLTNNPANKNLSGNIYHHNRDY